MVELIDMNILVGRLTASHTAHASNSREESLLNRDLRIVLDMPTTTEADIRERAINEFAEKLKRKIISEIDDCAEELEWVDSIAEQLKGE